MSERSLEKFDLDFIKGIEYKLQTPLITIQGYTEMFQQGCFGPLTAQQYEAMAIIARQSDKLKRLMDRLDLLLMLDAERSKWTPSNITEIITQLVQYHQPQVNSTVRLTTRVAQNLPVIMGSPILLIEALGCLLENILKLTPPGGALDLAVTAEGRWLIVTISGAVTGLADAVVSYLLDNPSLFTGAGPKLDSEEVGLELTIVKTIVKAHAGQIEVQPHPTLGNQLVVKLPATCPETAVDQPAPSQKPWRILVVDDEENITWTLALGLRKLQNCEVVTTNSGRQALALFGQQPFDLLITDYKMPEIDGLELVALIREQYLQTITVLITAHRKETILEHATQLQIRHILDKPIELKKFREIVDEILKEMG